MIGFALVLGAVCVVYVWSRVFAGSNALTVYELDVSTAEEGERIIGCYNIAHGRGGEVGVGNRRADGKAALMAHLESIGRAIRDEGLDVVVLNEVDFSSSWSWRVNEAKVIAKAAGLRFVMEQRSYDMSLLFYELRFGNAVLSRYPIREAELVDLPAFKPHEALFFGRKNGSSCVIETPEGALRVTPVHLEHRDEATRQASIQILANLAERERDVAHVIMGDFNTADVFMNSEILTFTGPKLLTFPSMAPKNSIDWIFSNAAVDVSEAGVFGETLSDHLGVRAGIIFAVDKALDLN